MATILVIDDKPDEVALVSQLNLEGVVSATVVHPEDVAIEELESADLVLVDYQLDDSNWEHRNEGPPSRQPKDGLALASLLRRHVHDLEKASPTAFAILSSEVAKLALPLPAENRLHVLSRLNNLEWVFERSTPGKPDRLSAQVVELAKAVRRLPARWPRDDAHEAASRLMEMLGLNPDCEDHSQLLDDVTACSPPIHELSEWSHGLAIVRWILHRILPYPCFLWDSYHLAARLRVEHRWFKEAISSNSGLATWLAEAKYGGLLSDFSGQRWWRGRIERLLWEATRQQSFDVDAIVKSVSDKHGSEAKRSTPSDHPVVVVNSSFSPLDQFAARSECVRIRPDDWPPYADQPWTTVELAKSEVRLGAIVVNQDIGRIHDDD